MVGHGKTVGAAADVEEPAWRLPEGWQPSADQHAKLLEGIGFVVHRYPDVGATVAPIFERQLQGFLGRISDAGDLSALVEDGANQVDHSQVPHAGRRARQPSLSTRS